ncbi:MAG: integrase, partial [Sphingomonadaceae bacterium]|nr:integrase [Sphingomonadaceae bacterium]
IGGLLGHASPQTTQRYAHLIDESAAAAAALVAGQIKNPAG